MDVSGTPEQAYGAAVQAAYQAGLAWYHDPTPERRAAYIEADRRATTAQEAHVAHMHKERENPQNTEDPTVEDHVTP
jgi:hypothetical protein